MYQRNKKNPSQDNSTYGGHQRALDILSLGCVFLTQATENMLMPGKKFGRSKLARVKSSSTCGHSR